MILPAVRDPRLVTVRRGGTLTDEDHRLLALWAADCAEHVLHLFEDEHPCDTRPREAVGAARAAAADGPAAGLLERDWQRDRLPERVRALVLEDQARRDAICWSVFGG
ncbi:putative immunity protein [Kineococcus terrestris]|uniref:putative immunity protein n=1 Tax=Kineococcus terrestris TaxID=2044856 RepID=UPI0034DB6252